MESVKFFYMTSRAHIAVSFDAAPFYFGVSGRRNCFLCNTPLFTMIGALLLFRYSFFLIGYTVFAKKPKER